MGRRWRVSTDSGISTDRGIVAMRWWRRQLRLMGRLMGRRRMPLVVVLRRRRQRLEGLCVLQAGEFELIVRVGR